MKPQNKLLIIITLFVILLLSCATLASGGSNTGSSGDTSTVNNNNGGADNTDNDNSGEGIGGSSGSSEAESAFPMPSGISNLMSDESSANFQIEASIDEMVAFYRTELVDGWGLEERELLTVISDTTVNLVFDGHSSGQAVVVQMVDLGNGTVNINIRFEDV